MAMTMPSFPARHLAILLAPVLLAACASTDEEYPSLAIRPAERIDPDAQQPALPPPAPVPADMLARAEKLKGEAEAADAGFQRLAPGVTAKAQAARGAAVASDRWADAQIALAGLDSQRSKTAGALADLDILFAERAVALESRDAIDEIRQVVVKILAGQDATLARLKGMIEE